MKRKVEIEGKEAVQLPNGQSYMAEGPSHENGGIPIELPVGSRVYSKRVKKDGKSMAERKAKRDRDLKSMVNTVMDNPFDGPSEAAMRRMMTAYAQQEAADMDTMERAQMKKEATQSMESNLPDDAFSSPDQMKCGGKVKKYKKGGIVIDPEKRGTFKAQATKMGMSVSEAANYILENPDEFSGKMRKKANFAKNFAMAYGGEIMEMMAGGGMIKRADGSYSKRGLWDNIRDNIGSGKEPTPEMLEQERKIKAKMMYGGRMYAEGGEVDMELEDIINAMIDARLDERMGGQPEGMEQGEMEEEGMEQGEMEEEEMGYGGKLKKMAEGGVVKNGTTKRSTRKGKKMMVYMDGSWHHFGDSSMDDFRTHKSEKRKKAFYDRHKKNLQGDSPRAKAFRVYARKTWENGGTIPMYQLGTSKGGVPMLYGAVPTDPVQQPQMMDFSMPTEANRANIYFGDMPAMANPELTMAPTGEIAGDNFNLNLGTPVSLGKPAGSAIQATPTPDASSWMQGINPAPKQRIGTKIGNAIGAASQFIGSNMGPLGIAVGALGPLAATIINRIGDKTNESFYEDYGREGLAANAASMRGVEASRQMGMEDIARQQAGSVAQTRGMGSVNAARGVQQMAGAQAMRASTVANQQATTQQAGLMGQRANLLNARDAQVMQARQAADQANVEDRDAFFTALSSNLSNLGTGMMYAARNRKPAQTAAQAINAKVLG